MQITLPRSALFAALGMVKAVVERRNTIPILSNVRITVDASGLRLIGTDLDIEISTRVAGQPAATGETTVPAGMLADIVAKFPDKADVTLSLAADGQTLTVASGRARLNLQTLPASDFPDISAGAFDCRFTLPPATLARMLGKTEFAISSEETRYYLNGTFWHRQDDKLVVVATDGHRLARIAVPSPAENPTFKGIIVPTKTVSRLRVLAKATEADMTVEISETKIRVTAGETVLTSKLIDGTFPDYKRVIPASSEKHMTVDRAALAGAVDRVSTVATERGRAVKMALTLGTLQLTVNNTDAGTGEETLDVDYAGEPIDIGFNSRYVADALEVLAADSVVFGLNQPGDPALLKSPSDDDLLVVLMPMRV
ncbi:DNA polymerase III subunit beta [Kaistia sp. MMO-174]|uniref:DNA polymerase III subunit beta n=1 Tax=Kaistia sp. MMO-174 TaxID=3081256 RepID=UPI003018ABAF